MSRNLNIETTGFNISTSTSFLRTWVFLISHEHSLRIHFLAWLRCRWSVPGVCHHGGRGATAAGATATAADNATVAGGT